MIPEDCQNTSDWSNPLQQDPSSDGFIDGLDNVEEELELRGSKHQRNSKFDWTERIDCDHAGHYRDTRDPDLLPMKRRPHRKKDSIKVGKFAVMFPE